MVLAVANVVDRNLVDRVRVEREIVGAGAGALQALVIGQEGTYCERFGS
jgi:hypothetical protein